MTNYCCGSVILTKAFINLFGGVYHRHLGMLVFILYLVVGAFVFSACEYGENAPIGEPELKTIIIDTAVKGTLNKTLAKVNVLRMEYVEGQSRYVRVSYYYAAAVEIDARYDKSRWDFMGSLFFSMTVASSIGFGNLFPVTDWGKIACTAYCSFGIPVYQIAVEHARSLIIFLTLVVERALMCSTKKERGNASRVESRGEDIPGSNDFVPILYLTKGMFESPKIRIITSVLFLFLVVAFCPVFIFMALESWTLISSIYFDFTTLTTIGFGDLIASDYAGQPGAAYDKGWQNNLYKICLTFWLIFAIGYVDMMLSMSRIQIEKSCTKITNYMCRRNIRPRSIAPTPRSDSSLSTRDEIFKVQDLENEPDDIGDNHNNTMAQRVNTRI